MLAPERVSCEVELFWMTPVTFGPMTALIVVVPLPVPEFVIVPELLTEVFERVIVLPDPPVAFSIKLPVPVIPPVNDVLLPEL